MPVDYEAIRVDNKDEYGNIKRWGKNIFVYRYDERTHFIYELLQNAEDALAKRDEAWEGKRTVTFSLSSSELTVSHFGTPFDEADVRGVCGIDESTKTLTDIGRFGIGFKSVYAFTNNPEIHSGDEHFAIDHYVYPRHVSELCLEPEETIIRIPFRDDEPDAKDKILNGLRNLSTRTLLFLRQIEEICWNDVDSGVSGLYLRRKPEPFGSIGSKIALIGKDDEKAEEEYIVFSREVSHEDTSAGFVEIAFALAADNSGEERKIQIQPATNTELVAFFPTVLSTNLGFVMQGPYRTTPSRDNVPEADEWNRHLVKETSHLLVDALKELKEIGLLNVSALESLPLDDSLSRFTPLFDAVRDALRTKQLLPAYNGGHIAAQNAMLARGRGLRDFVSPAQLTALYESDESLFWLSDEITAVRAPRLHKYLTDILEVGEVTPFGLISKLERTFLESQQDKWIENLYEFLNEQRSNELFMRRKPLIRLEDGTHTIAQDGDTPKAYLPTENRTDFPIVRASVCQSDEAIEFLKYLGLREPDLVDDVIAHVLPKYGSDTVKVTATDYQSDIDRMLIAFESDSREQRRRLVSELREVKFIRAVDASHKTAYFVQPEDAYQATEALTNLFEDVPGVLFVDNSKAGFRGERIRALLRAVGTQEYLARKPVGSTLTPVEKRELRLKRGDPDISYEMSVEDYTLMGLESLLDILSTSPDDEAHKKAELLWAALSLFERNNYASAFNGIYRWFRYTERRQVFPANFVNSLNKRAWVPDKNGVLRFPKDVVFDDTGWDENPILQSEIQFMPDAVTELAEKAGMDPDILVLLKQHGITSVEQLNEILPEKNYESDEDEQSDDKNASDTSATPGNEHNTSESGNSENPNNVPLISSPNHDNEKPDDSGDQLPNQNEQTEGADNDAPPITTQNGATPATKEFISYVAASQNDNDEESDGLTYEERMSLESQALELILSEEPSLQRTPTNNPGFDLFEKDNENVRVKWVEVKSMRGSLENRPATLTRTQFEFAQKKQDAFWLYVVENVGGPDAKVIRIQNPAGKAKTFTFDRGWRNATETLESQT